MNAVGATLASDSVVSFGGGGKSFPTVNKIFTLSGRQPVGIMLSGSAVCHTANLPWERIIGAYRERIGTEEKDSFKEYIDEFFSVVYDYFDANENNNSIRHDLVRYFSERVFSASIARERMKGELGEEVEHYIPEVKDYFELALEERIKEIHPEAIDGLEEYKLFEKSGKSVDEKNWIWYNHIKDNNGENVSAAAKIFSKRHSVEKHQDLLEDIFLYHLVKFGMDCSWKESTQFVFVGFAKGDTRPNAVSFRASSNIGASTFSDFQWHQTRPMSSADYGSLRKEEEFSNSTPAISNPNTILPPDHNTTYQVWTASAFMLPYAVMDEMQSLMNGLHNQMWGDLVNSFPSSLLSVLPDIIVNALDKNGAINEDAKQEIIDAINNESDEIRNSISFMMNDFITSAVRRESFRYSVSSLPIADCSDLARFLVSMEANMMYWTSGSNTVGGPIDVATITKEDGFLWVDTKQNYDPIKNPRQMDIDRASSNFR